MDWKDLNIYTVNYLTATRQQDNKAEKNTYEFAYC